MTGAVIVLYNPDLQLLQRVVNALIGQADLIYLIDNSATSLRHAITKHHSITYIPLYENRGIAAAQNIGLRHLLRRGCHYLLLADQDSIASPDLVAELKRRHRILSRVYDIAAVGPMPINRHSRKPYIAKGDERILRRIEHEGYPFYEAHSIIASFSLLSAAALRRTGLMNEKLFIDFVDQEWCWRARECGQRIFVAPDLGMEHEQGRFCRRLGLGLNISTPPRLYYQIRNLLWLSQSPQAPRSWKRRNLRKLCYKIVGYPLLVAPRWDYLKSVVRGLRDGLTKKYKR